MGRGSPSTVLPKVGGIHSVLMEEPREGFHWVAMVAHEHDVDLVMFSRTAPQRVSQQVDLARVDVRWLTENMDARAVAPSLERLHHEISLRCVSGSGLIWIDGMEYLSSIQGFDAVLAFIRSTRDVLAPTEWSIVLPFNPLAFSDAEVARIRREARPFKFPEFAPSTPVVEAEEPVPMEAVEVNPVEAPAPEEEPDVEAYVQLGRIPRSALSKNVLRRRIEQWKAMGFEMSNLEHAMTLGEEQRWAVYADVEDAVRLAIECLNRIEMLQVRGDSVLAAKLRFSTLQLGDLERVEAQLDAVFSEG